MKVPKDLLDKLTDEHACAMGVPVEWVLRAACEMYFASGCEAQVDAVERVMSALPKKRIARMPRIRVRL